MYERGRFLERDEYLAISAKAAPAFAQKTELVADEKKFLNREMVFDLFLWYEQRKQQANMWDRCDLVLSIAKRLRAQPALAVRPLLDALVVDEVQDFTLASLALFLELLADPNALMVGGDTAQTIASVAFRFTDVKDLLYERRRRAVVRGDAVVPREPVQHFLATSACIFAPLLLHTSLTTVFRHLRACSRPRRRLPYAQRCARHCAHRDEAFD